MNYQFGLTEMSLHKHARNLQSRLPIHICNIRLYRAENRKVNVFKGSMSDKEIVRQCDIIPLLEQLIDSGYLQRRDGVMADKGCLIEKEMRAVGLQLNLPLFSRSKRQMPARDVLVTKRIAKHRMHIERAIAKIKKFKIVSDKIPNTRLGIINHIWYVVSMLSLFQPYILK